MSSHESEPKRKLVKRDVLNLGKLGARALDRIDHLFSRVQERITDTVNGSTSADFFREVSEQAHREREEARLKELTSTVPEEESPPSIQLPAVMTETEVALVEQADSRLRLPYFGIEHFKPSQIAQLFAEGVEPQPFDPRLSYRIRSYAPPVGTVLHFLFERINKTLGQGQQPVRLLLLQPVKTAGGEEVPIVQSKALITSACMYLSKPTPWMEIRPMGPRIHEAGVDIRLGQPAVIKIKPPDLEKGLFEPYVVFLHDPRRLVRLGALLEEGYMDGKSSICPLSEVARNYQEAQRSPLLAHLPEPEPSDSARPPMYEPFPIRKPSPPRTRRVKAVVILQPEPAALPAPKQAEKKSRQKRRRNPPPTTADAEEGSGVAPATHH